MNIMYSAVIIACSLLLIVVGVSGQEDDTTRDKTMLKYFGGLDSGPSVAAMVKGHNEHDRKQLEETKKNLLKSM